MREVARGDKPYLRKSTDRKAQIRKAFVQFCGLICALRSVDFSGKVYHPEPPHAQSLFLFPIVFGINFIYMYFPQKRKKNQQLKQKRKKSAKVALRKNRLQSYIIGSAETRKRFATSSHFPLPKKFPPSLFPLFQMARAARRVIETQDK